MAIEVLEKIEKQLYTLEEFFQLEEKSPTKNEFRNGKIIPMPHSSINHNRISGNLFFQLYAYSYQANKFEVFNSLQKIYLPTFNQTTYPDACIVIGEPKKHGNYAISNPTLIVEVASESTERYDRRGKFKKYKTLPSFIEYVLVDQDAPAVDVLSKTELGWIMESYIGLEETVKLKSLDCEIKMADIYRNVEGLDSPQGKLDLDKQ